MKRVLSVFLILALLLGVMPPTAVFAESGDLEEITSAPTDTVAAAGDVSEPISDSEGSEFTEQAQGDAVPVPEDAEPEAPVEQTQPADDPAAEAGDPDVSDSADRIEAAPEDETVSDAETPAVTAEAEPRMRTRALAEGSDNTGSGGEVPSSPDITYAEWYEDMRERALKADHVVSEDYALLQEEGIDLFFGRYYSQVFFYDVIEPGETVAILPVSNGNYSTIGGTIWQFDDPVANTNYLTHGSVPTQLGLTPVEYTNMPVPYGERAAYDFDDRVDTHEETGDTECLVYDGYNVYIRYVSLYRNDTGLPIVFNGARGGEFGASKQVKFTGYRVNHDHNGHGSDVCFSGTVNIKTQPTLYFAEPYYDLTVGGANSTAILDNFIWSDSVPLPTKLYVDNKDHEYVFPIPMAKGGWFEYLIKTNSSKGFFQPNSDHGGGNSDLYYYKKAQIIGDTYVCTFNFQNTSRVSGNLPIGEVLADEHMDIKFGPGVTLYFDAQGGTINGKETLFVPIGTRGDWAKDIAQVRLADYVPVREGYAFVGWKNPKGVLITDMDPSFAHTDKWLWSGLLSDSKHCDLSAEWELVDLNYAEVTLSGTGVIYNGTAQTPVPTVTLEGKTLTKDTDYTVSYKNNLNAGTAAVTITGKGNYTGTVTKTFKINAAAIANAAVSGISDKTYTGKTITQTPVVKVGSTTLRSGTDYTVSYQNNTNAGTVTVTITGKGNYTGIITKTFQINAVSIAKAAVTGISDKSYTGKAITQTPVVKAGSTTLRSGTDYTVSYQNNTNAGTATVTITGKGNYTGTVSKTFAISCAAPALPTLTTAANGIIISWSKVSGAEKYRVFRKTGSGAWQSLGDTAGTSWTDRTAEKGKTYSYTICCVSKDGKTLTSSYNQTGKSVLFYIATPSITKLESASNGVIINWGKVDGAQKYRVFRKTGSGSWQSLGDASGTSWTDRTAQKGTTYSYTVRCISSDSKTYTSSFSSTGWSVKHGTAEPTNLKTPVITSLQNASGGIIINWGKVSGATRYRVFRRVGNSSWERVADVTDTRAVDRTAKKGTTYTYTVRCVTSDGKTYTSSFSSTGWTVTRG